MDLLVSWLLFPALLMVVLVGCGLLVQVLVGIRIAAALLPGVGFAVLICVAHLTTAFDSTAELTTPVIVALAAVGYLGAWPLDWRSAGRAAAPAIAAGTGVFLIYGAPVILSGDAGFAGYIKLDDTATWLALTDRVMEHGRSLEGLAPSSYEATLAFNLGDGYPVGAFLPLGVGAQLIATDAAWVVQPYTAVLAGLLGAVMTELARPLIRSGSLRAGAAFIAAQPALLVGYALWGGIKEVEAATLIALSAALAPLALERAVRPVSLVPVAISAAALLAVLSLGGAIWLVPILGVPMFLLWRGSPRRAWIAAAVFAGVCIVFALPLVAGGRLLPPTSSPLTSATAQGNLLEPLSPWQVVGIWPVGDFRLRPDEGLITAIAIAVALAMAAVGVSVAASRRALGLVLYWSAVSLGCLVLVVVGSPWVEGKALATASPGIALAATLGIAALYQRGLRAEAALAAVVVAGGVLVSNVLGYRDVNLAPRAQLEELESIGEKIDAEGPTLMTEYQPYGVRHFLREADPEGASELRRRQVPLRDGTTLEKGFWTDTDSLDLQGLFTYRTLVLRRSPGQSRPPLPYRLVSSGHYYDVWQRPAAASEPMISHLPLGTAVDPGAAAPCDQVEGLAGAPDGSGTLAYVPRPPNVVIRTAEMRHPQSWTGLGSTVVPDGAGTASSELDLPVAGRWTIWLGGSIRGRMEAFVDGASAGSVRQALNNAGLYVELGDAELAAGEHTVELRYHGTDRHPGSGGRTTAIGPLILANADPAGEKVSFIPASRASELCGQRLDWIEAGESTQLTAAGSSP